VARVSRHGGTPALIDAMFGAGHPREHSVPVNHDRLSLPGSSGREDRERAVMQRVISDCPSALTRAGRPRVRIPDTGEQGSSRPCQDRRTHRPQCGAELVLTRAGPAGQLPAETAGTSTRFTIFEGTSEIQRMIIGRAVTGLDVW
jgi:hypothetical protein